MIWLADTVHSSVSISRLCKKISSKVDRVPLCKNSSSKCEALVLYQTDETLRVSISLKKPHQIVDMNGNDTFLDINNAHLRVNNGNVQASTFVLDQIDFIASSNASTTVGFNNPTTAFLAVSNIEVGTANLFVDTSTSNVGIGTNAPQDTLHINGGTRIAGHILPTVNDTYDLGSAEYKIRHLFLGNSSLWLGDETRITFTGGKMKFRRRKKNALPRGLATIAANRGHTSEQQTTTAALAHAGVSTVEEMKLEHWIDYTKTLDETKEINDIFTEDANDYEATTASEAFKEIGDDIFSPHNVAIGKTTTPTSALDVVGTVKATAFEGDGSALTGITSGQWTESSGDIYRSSGNVGVGTDSPAKTLHVAGTMRIANATTNTETTDIVKIAAVNTTTTTSAPHTGWSQEQKLIAYQPSSYDYFGQQSAVSGDGNTICVGARNEDTTAGDSGAVYVYTYNSGTWTYRARLKASDAQSSDVLGEAGLAISDDGRTIVVAARLEDTGGTNAGAAYVFMSSNSTWTSFTQQKLQASNKAADDQFCRCDVSGDGNTIIVGAPHEDGPTNSVASSGAAYIYSRSGNSWSEDQILYPSDPVVNNYFGVDNALNEDGTVAAIAATGDDTSATDSGAVYIFTKSNGTWSQETKLKITNGGPNASDNWGGVSLSDDGLTLSAGTSNDDSTASQSGAVYVFNKSGGTWSQTVKLKASNAGVNDKLGGRTRISGTGDTIVSGAREEDTGTTNAGSAYIFTLNNGTWTQRQQIQASDRASGDLFGDSVGISKDGTVISVGAVLEHGGGTDSGSAYIFRGTGGGTTTTTTTIDSKLKVNDTIVATAFEGDGSALTGITSGQWTESSGNIYRSSGNVGIGTAIADYKLHAYTNTTGSNIMELDHDGTTTSGGPNGTNYWMQFRYGGRVGMTIKAPDNSVNTPVTFATNNAFKFMVDSHDALTMDHNGILTTPSKPAFYAWDNASSRSGTTLTFNSTTYNVGSHYNTSTSRFKTPVAGTYIFAAVIAHDTPNTLADVYYSFYVDGSSRRDIMEGTDTHDAHYEKHGVYIVNLNANQYVDIRARSSHNITFVNGNHGAYYRNCFQGALLG